jgi:hypothetical protein
MLEKYIPITKIRAMKMITGVVLGAIIFLKVTGHIVASDGIVEFESNRAYCG